MSKLTPTHYEVGYIGEGEYKTWLNGKHSPAYSVWKTILKRCYDNKHPAYLNVTVHPEWLNFQNFAKWYNDNYLAGYQIDKDLLSKGTKQYSPYTCVFLPQNINNIMVEYPKGKQGLPRGLEKRGDSYRVKVANKAIGTCKSLDAAIALRQQKHLEHVRNVVAESVNAHEITQDIANKIIKKIQENY